MQVLLFYFILFFCIWKPLRHCGYASIHTRLFLQLLIFKLHSRNILKLFQSIIKRDYHHSHTINSKGSEKYAIIAKFKKCCFLNIFVRCQGLGKIILSCNFQPQNDSFSDLVLKNSTPDGNVAKLVNRGQCFYSNISYHSKIAGKPLKCIILQLRVS